jgi:hypothetical protein
MFEDDASAGETAISYTDEFVDAAVAKLDGLFGEGYAQKNPDALVGYIAACARNLESFMTAASAMQGSMMAEAIAAMQEEIGNDPLPQPPPSRRKPKGKS